MLAWFAGMASAEFMLENVDVLIHDIQPDGSAKVSESIKLIILGNQAQEEYDRGFSMNDLAFWSTVTGLPDVKQHVNPSKVAMTDMRVRPQPRGKCNPIQGICHGELLIEYDTRPVYSLQNGTSVMVPKTGLFTTEKYKPRTTKYSITPDSLSFTTTPQGNILLVENVHLRIKPPAEAVFLDLNPKPEDMDRTLPVKLSEVEWSDTILVKFSVVFEVEDALEKEVSEFFYGMFGSVQGTLTGQYGSALIAIIIIVVGGYIYISTEKRKVES
jgi:hypothetical protein